MKLIKNKLNLFLLFIALTGFTSCNGRNGNASKTENTTLIETISVGDTVQKLGDHLWYVFQDKKNNYWFSSNFKCVADCF